MIKPTVLANALAIVVSAGYILCRLVAAIAPEFLFNVGQSWFHTVNLAPLRATGSMSTGMFVLWVLEMHVDGFRFDLAPSLARESDAVERSACFFDVIHQDPVISQAKLIAEPWDVAQGGYQARQLPGGLGRVERSVPRCHPSVLAR
jgi:hypothetical protein